MERKNKNVSLSVIKVPKTPSLTISISWSCPQSDWYTLYKLKKGYKTEDPQFKSGSECMTLCYSLFQRIRERTASAYTGIINCLTCNVQDGRFQVCYNTGNKLSNLKRTLKSIIKELDPSRVHKQYGINMRNLGSTVDREELNYTVLHLIKSLKKDICIVAAGNVKLTSTKKGKKISESENLNNLAKYLADAFPKLRDPPGKKVKPAFKRHIIPDIKTHYILKIKNNNLSITSMLVANYIQKTLAIHTSILDKDVIIWTKDPGNKLKSIKKADRYKREMLKSKKNVNENIAYHAIESGCVNNKHVLKFYKSNPTKSEIARMVVAEL